MANAAITVDLNAKIAQFETELKRATGTLDNFGKKGNQIASGFKTAFATLGASVTVGALVSLAKRGIDAADALNDLSDRTGVAVKDLASLDLAAKLSDTSLDAVGKAIQRLNLSVGQAAGGSKEVAKSLKDLGITSGDARERLFQLADAYKESGGQGKVLSDIQKVLGKSYTEMIPLLKLGGDGLREMARASESFADAMARLAPDAAKFNDQLDLLKQNAAGAAASILTKLVPSFNEWIAVGQEVVKTGSLLDKIRFFALGNASDEIVGKVRKVAAEAAKAAEAARKAAASNLVGDIKLPQPKALSFRSSAKDIDLAALAAEDLARNLKLAADEQERFADDAAFMREVNESQSNAVNDMAQEWVEAGRALQAEMITPLEAFENRLEYINELWRRGVIDIGTYDRAIEAAFDDNLPAIEKAKSLAEELGLTFTSAFEDAVAGGKSLSEVLKALEQDIIKIITRKMVTEPLGNFVSGLDFGSIFPFANGGIMTSAGSLPLNKYASGGIANSPQLAMFGEGSRPEAYVPLPDGRRIPVAMSGGGSTVINMNINTPDANSFRASQGQITAQMGRALARGRRYS